MRPDDPVARRRDVAWRRASRSRTRATAARASTRGSRGPRRSGHRCGRSVALERPTRTSSCAARARRGARRPDATFSSVARSVSSKTVKAKSLPSASRSTRSGVNDCSLSTVAARLGRAGRSRPPAIRGSEVVVGCGNAGHEAPIVPPTGRWRNSTGLRRRAVRGDAVGRRGQATGHETGRLTFAASRTTPWRGTPSSEPTRKPKSSTVRHGCRS